MASAVTAARVRPETTSRRAASASSAGPAAASAAAAFLVIRVRRMVVSPWARKAFAYASNPIALSPGLAASQRKTAAARLASAADP